MTMRINVYGNAVTPDMVAEALKACEKEYGLKVRTVTLYVRFEDENGNIAEPTEQGHKIILNCGYSMNKEVYKQKEAAVLTEPISIEKMEEFIKGVIQRRLTTREHAILVDLLDMGIDINVFTTAFNRTMCELNDKFSITYFKYVAILILEQQTEKATF